MSARDQIKSLLEDVEITRQQLDKIKNKDVYKYHDMLSDVEDELNSLLGWSNHSGMTENDLNEGLRKLATRCDKDEAHEIAHFMVDLVNRANPQPKIILEKEPELTTITVDNFDPSISVNDLAEAIYEALEAVRDAPNVTLKGFTITMKKIEKQEKQENIPTHIPDNDNCKCPLCNL